MPFEVTSPVSSQVLDRLDERPEQLQFSSALTDADYRLLGEWIGQHPLKTLRAYGARDGSVTDLEFLRWFPTVRRLEVDVPGLEDLTGLRHVGDDLVALGLGATRRRLPLSPLARFRSLRELSLEGHTRDVGVLSELTGLVDLTLRSVSLPDLGALVPLRELATLRIRLGSTTELGLLPRIGRLRHLELWRIKGLDDVSAIGALPELERLHLQTLPRVTRLPDLSAARSLTHLWLETMTGLSDLTTLPSAPSLHHVALVDAAHLGPEQLAPLLACPALVSARVGLGSVRKNEAAARLLGALATSGDWRPAAPTTRHPDRT